MGSSRCFVFLLTALGGSSSKTSTIEVMAETEKEVMTLDDEETFGNFYKSVPPSMLQESTVVLTEDDLSRIQTHTPKSVCTVAVAVLCQGVDSDACIMLQVLEDCVANVVNNCLTD